MVIMCGGNCSLNLLFSEIKVALVDRGICEEDDIKIIYTAMVPIIKLVHKCGIPVCFFIILLNFFIIINITTIVIINLILHLFNSSIYL